MTEATINNYWVSGTAITITLNAMGLPNYIQVSTVANAVIMCYVKDIDDATHKDILGFDAGHNYRRWQLVGAPTVFNSNTVKYVYAAIPKDPLENKALIVFPSERIDIYGKNAEGEQLGSTDYLYIFLQGEISATDANAQTPREWTQRINTGTLSTDEAIAAGYGSTWYQYSTIDQIVTFLTDLTMKAGTKFLQLFAKVITVVSGGRIEFGTGGKYVDGLADHSHTEEEKKADDHSIVTPAFAEKEYLSKVHDDTCAGDITFGNSITVNGETILRGQVTIGNFERDTMVGIGSREGARILPDGTIIARNLEISESLVVPTIKYNSIEVLAGTEWHSAGKARIRSIVSTDDSKHEVSFILDLNDGEPGGLLVGDILRGFWHNPDGGNATSDADDRRGNMSFAGFTSLYLRVSKVEDVVERPQEDGRSIYILKDAGYTPQEGDIIHEGGYVHAICRPKTDAEGNPTGDYYPYPQAQAALAVSGSFDAAHPERQKFFVYTTQYMARFDEVNTWEWEEHTFKGGWGDLTGFVMLERTSEGDIIRKEFDGESLATGNAYIYGILEQFERFSDHVDVVLSKPDGVMSAGISIRAQFVLKDAKEQVILDGYKLSITRQSGLTEADAAWNEAMATLYPDGIPAALDFTQSDVPTDGAVFVVVATRKVNGETYRTSTAFTLSCRVVADVYSLILRVTPSINADGTLADGEVASLNGHVVNTYGANISGFTYSVERNTDDAAADAAWNASRGDDMASGTIQLTTRDLGVDNASFIVTGRMSEGGNVYRTVTAHTVIRKVTKQKLKIDLGRSSETSIASQVDVTLSPRLCSGISDITTKTLDNDWSWGIETGNEEFDAAWNEEHRGQRELRIRAKDLPPNWQTLSPLRFTCAVDYRGTEVRTTTEGTRAYPTWAIGEAFSLNLSVIFDVDVDTLRDEDFTIEVVDVNGNIKQRNFTRSANVFTVDFLATETEHMTLGIYRVTIWYKRGNPTEQGRLDFAPGFELVANTDLKS